MMASCAREVNPVLSNDSGSTLHTEGDHKISRFILPVDELRLPDDATEMVFHLTSHTDAGEHTFEGNIAPANALNHLCEMRIPTAQQIPDGDYTMKFHTAQDRFLNTQFIVTIRSEMVSRLLGSQFIYGAFAQKGTVDDPYLVTDDLFFDFLYTLRQDPAHGKGTYFLQTENITANQQGDDSDGRGFANESFAGTYDGGRHTLELSYAGTGGSADRAVGLFRELKDNAIVKNLVLQANMARLSDTVGVVAAFSSGDVILENIRVRGNITGAGNRVGGLLGVARGGIVEIRSYTPEVMITGAGNEVGGLIGRVEDAVVMVTGTYNEDNVPFKFIEGRECVGGAVGYLKGGFHISDVSFSHTVSSQDQSVKVIQGTKYTGGLIGSAHIDADCSLSGVSIAMPVWGGDYTGGLIGELTKVDTGGIVVDFCAVKQSGAIVSGKNNVGGFIGSARVDYIEFNKNSTKKSLMGAQVTGVAQVGGVVGSCLTGSLKINPGLKVEANVSGSTGNVGGFAGLLRCDTPVLLDEGLEFVSTMDVSGLQNAGGFAGWVERTEIRGTTTITPHPGHVADISPGHSIYPGKVNGNPEMHDKALNAGGAIGYGTNVTLKQLYVTGSIYGQSNVGGIAGRLDGSSVASCGSRCGTLMGSQHTGGIVGYLSGSQQLEGSINYSTISGGSYAGGIAGYLEGGVRIDKSANLGNVTGSMQLGGIAGYGDRGAQVITDCGNFGTITSSATPSAESGIGGIIGKDVFGIRILGCANHGKVTVSAGHDHNHTGVGGIAGYLGEGSLSRDDILVDRSCNHAEISTTAGGSVRNRLGGIVGYLREGVPLQSENSVTNSYNRAPVKGVSKDDNGGIVGTAKNCTAIRYSVNSGKVDRGNGGIGHRDYSWEQINHTGLYMESGTGGTWMSTTFSPSAKSQKSSYPLLDFNQIWDVDGTTNGGYPYLRNCFYQFAATTK